MTKHEASYRPSDASDFPQLSTLPTRRQPPAAPEKGNVRALQHGVFTERFRGSRRDEIVDELMALPHVSELDLPAAREVAALLVQSERVDAALADGRVETDTGDLRALLEHRRRLSRQIERWLTAFDLTPAARLARRAGHEDPAEPDRDFMADLRQIPDDELAAELERYLVPTAKEMNTDARRA